MTVHFSAFGSRSLVGEIVEYEWAEDASGVYDIDATQAMAMSATTMLNRVNTGWDCG